MGNATMNDVLAASYQMVVPPPPMTKSNTAVMFIDIQQLATPQNLMEKAVKGGMDSDDAKSAVADYQTRFDAALANCAKVLAATRKSGIPPIHVRIQALSHTGRDTGPIHKAFGWTVEPSNKATDFLPEAAPNDDEMIINKTASGAFAGTGLDSTLRNMGIQYLLLCGFVTDECVETTARTAIDLGFLVQIVSDATTTYTKERWESSISLFAGLGMAADTGAVCALLPTLTD